MSKRDDPQAQQQMQDARRYMNALERGDPAVVAAMLDEAEHDPTLESLLLKVNRLYQLQDGIAVHDDKLLQARRFLSILREEAHTGTSPSEHKSGKPRVPICIARMHPIGLSFRRGEGVFRGRVEQPGLCDSDGFSARHAAGQSDANEMFPALTLFSIYHPNEC